MDFPKDGVDARLVYAWSAACGDGDPDLLELCCNFVFRPSGHFVISYAFVINTALYHYIVVTCMNKQILAYM
jgi:hypothetical protein